MNGFWIFVSVIWIFETVMCMNGHTSVLLKPSKDINPRIRENIETNEQSSK